MFSVQVLQLKGISYGLILAPDLINLTAIVPWSCCQMPAIPLSQSQAVKRGATPRLKLTPSRAGTSIPEPLDLITRPAHASVSGSDSAQRMAERDIAIGPEASQKIPRAKSSFDLSLCFQKMWDISSWGTLSGEGRESRRKARLQGKGTGTEGTIDGNM